MKIMIAAISLTLTAAVLYLSGFRVLNTYGTSMLPELETGDLIVIHPKENVKLGDIITYKKTINGKTYLITHRVVGKTENGFVTKGDNLQRVDENVKAEEVVGVYLGKIPKIGLMANFVRTFWGYMLLILIPGLALLIIELKSIVSGDSK